MTCAEADVEAATGRGVGAAGAEVETGVEGLSVVAVVEV